MDWQALLRANRAVARGSDLCAGGLSRFTLRTRLRNGSWQRVLPDVVVAHSGALTAWERRKAALLYAGSGAVLSHGSAGAMHGLTSAERSVEVSVPHGRRRQDREWVTLHQTSRACTPQLRDGLPCTPLPRTVVDLAGSITCVDDVTALVARAVQRRMLTVAELLDELETAPRQGSAFLRQVLGEIGAGSRSAGESIFLRLIHEARIPEPELNAPVATREGIFYADALWKTQRLIVEIDGAAWHLDALSWRRDLRRQNLLANAGYRILRFPVQRLRTDPAGVAAEIRIALRIAS